MEDKEKNDIQNDEIGNDIVTEPDSREKSKKRGYQMEIILIFIIGLLLGIMAKAESLKTVSIGFSDYRLKGGIQEYNLDEIEKKIIEEAEKMQQEAQQEQMPAQEGQEQGSANKEGTPQ